MSSRNNDAVRIDARDLRCKIGGGGNLGSQRPYRVCAARRAAQHHFIDNSAG